MRPTITGADSPEERHSRLSTSIRRLCQAEPGFGDSSPKTRSKKLLDAKNKKHSAAQRIACADSITLRRSIR
jgi:hypothetical protein